jgi:hypothetical protein
MKIFPLLLICTASLLGARPAAALPTETTFSLSIPDGPSPTDAVPVGTISFELDDEASAACRYWAEWENELGSLNTECWVDEMKARRSGSCRVNSTTALATMIGNTKGQPCSGFGAFGGVQSIFMLVGLENADSTIIGLVQWSAAGPYLSPLEGTPYP